MGERERERFISTSDSFLVNFFPQIVFDTQVAHMEASVVHSQWDTGPVRGLSETDEGLVQPPIHVDLGRGAWLLLTNGTSL